MTIHTRRRRRDTGEPGGFDARMAVAAIDAEMADVMVVAEGNGLRDDFIAACRIRGANQDGQRPERDADEDRAAENGDASECVRTAVKDLGHALVDPLRFPSATP